MHKPECEQCGQRVGWVGLGANLALVALKVGVGLASGSNALLADALNSCANVVTAFAILASRRLSGKQVDPEHPYGYAKAEFLATAVVSAIILISTLGLVVAALRHLVFRAPSAPHASAIVVAVASMVTNELLFHYMRCVGSEVGSETVYANAWANRLASLSSLVVLVGVVAEQLGLHHWDSVAALGVALVIVRGCWRSLRDSIAGLMDRSVGEETLRALEQAVRGVDGVQGVATLRTRLLGNSVSVDVAVLLAAGHTIADCQAIGEAVRAAVTGQLGNARRVMVDFVSQGGTEPGLRET